MITARDIMTTETVAALMIDSNLHTLPVVEGSRLVGGIGQEDVLRTLLPKENGE
jgi:CBS domain-containing protein